MVRFMAGLGLVDLSTCRPVDLLLLSTTKIRLGLGLGLVCG